MKHRSMRPLVAILAVVCVFSTHSDNASALYTTAQIDANLRMGVQTAVDMDACRNWVFTQANADVFSGASSTAALIRMMENGYGQVNGNTVWSPNGGCNYGFETWLSGRGAPKSIMPVEVTYGAQSIDLQINRVKMILGSMVEPNYSGAGGWQAIRDSPSWVTSVADAKDRYPNPPGGSLQLPALVGSRSKVASLSLDSAPTGSWLSGPGGVGSLLDTPRDDNTRYWFSPSIPIRLNIPSPGITKSERIVVAMKAKGMAAYKKADRIETLCEGSGLVASNWGEKYQYAEYSRIDECDLMPDTLVIDITLKYNYALTPTISVSPPKLPYSGGDVAITAKIENSGPTASPATTNWQTTRVIVDPGQTIGNNGDSSKDPCGYLTNYAAGSCAVASGQSGTEGFTVGTANKNFNDTLGSYPLGTKICYVLSAQPASMKTSNWVHSAPACVIFSKSPSAQVWGNDLRVGSALAANLGVSSKVSGLLTTLEGGTVATNFSGSSQYGLWRTGVDASGNKVTVNLPSNANSGSGETPATDKALYKPEYVDPHWEIKEVVRPSGSWGGTCQYSFDGLNTGLLLRMDQPRPAYIVGEKGSSAGLVTARKLIVGDGGSAGGYMWNRTSPVAGWIGQNIFGQNYTAGSCKDPSTANADDYNNANVYKYRLKSKFTVPTDADLSTVKLSITGAIDNRVKAFVNGCQLAATGWNYYVPHDRVQREWYNKDLRWLRAGYWAGSPAFAFENANDTGCQSFKPGANNDLEIWAQSTVPLTGLLIEDIGLTGKTIVTPKTTYGSWAEYGILAPDRVSIVASGSGLVTGQPDQSSWSKLTFANTSSAYGNFGAASSLGVIPDISGYFSSSSGIQKLNRNEPVTRVGDTGAQVKPQDLVVGGGVVLMNTNGTVRIVDDIVAGPGTKPGDMSQVVIIAKNIEIAGNVKRVDAWLIATDSINTCADVALADPLSASTCSNSLKINGALTAKSVYLRRTAGSETGSMREAAETLDLRGDAYIWAHSVSRQNGVLTTRSVTELPPRY